MPIATSIQIYLDKKQERLVMISTFPDNKVITTFFKQDAQLVEDGEARNAKIVMMMREYTKLGAITPPTVGGYNPRGQAEPWCRGRSVNGWAATRLVVGSQFLSKQPGQSGDFKT